MILKDKTLNIHLTVWWCLSSSCTLKPCVLTLDLSQVKILNMTKRTIEGIIVINFLICGALQLNRVRWRRVFGLPLDFWSRSKYHQWIFYFTHSTLSEKRCLQLWKEGSQCPSYFMLCNTPWRTEHFQILSRNHFFAKNQKWDLHLICLHLLNVCMYTSLNSEFHWLL